MTTQTSITTGLESIAELLAQALVRALARLKTGNEVSGIGEFVIEFFGTRIDLSESCRNKIWAAFDEAAARNRLVGSGIYLKVQDALQGKPKAREIPI